MCAVPGARAHSAGMLTVGTSPLRHVQRGTSHHNLSQVVVVRLFRVGVVRGRRSPGPERETPEEPGLAGVAVKRHPVPTRYLPTGTRLFPHEWEGGAVGWSRNICATDDLRGDLRPRSGSEALAGRGRARAGVVGRPAGSVAATSIVRATCCVAWSLRIIS